MLNTIKSKLKVYDALLLLDACMTRPVPDTYSDIIGNLSGYNTGLRYSLDTYLFEFDKPNYTTMTHIYDASFFFSATACIAVAAIYPGARPFCWMTVCVC